MEAKRNTISVRQLLFIFGILILSPAIRLLPKFASAAAKQAGWLSAIPSFFAMLIMVYILDAFYNKCGGKNLCEIIEILVGKAFGKLLLAFYFFWVLILTTLYIRYDAERLISSVYPDYQIDIFIISTLILVYLCLKPGYTVIARMGEVILPFVLGMFVLLNIFLLPKVRIDNVGPIYFNDIIPIFKASACSMAIVSYLFFLFFISDKVSNLKTLKRLGKQTSVFTMAGLTFLLFATIGVLGSSIAKRLPVPYLVAVKQISLFDTIENLESVVTSAWMLTDFIIISTFVMISLSILKRLFNLKNTEHFLKLFLVFCYFFSLAVSLDRFDLEDFSSKALIPINIIAGVIIPVFIFVIGKIRKKL